MLAVLSCSTTTEALEKLIHAGADINIPIKARDGRWLRAVDLAVQHHNYKAEQLLRSSEQYVNTNTILCTSTAVVNEERGIAKCSICNVIVKFPSRMSFLEIDQKLTEEAAATTTTNEQEDESIHTNNAPTKKEIFTSRIYLDLFLSSCGYKEMCKVEYHGVNNMHKLRKEISESWSILTAIQQACQDLQQPSDMSRTMIIDLCSGKCLTTTLLSILYPRGKFLAVDKLRVQMVPHNNTTTTNGSSNRWYLCQDIKKDVFVQYLKQFIQEHCGTDDTNVDPQRVPILVGMHLCGHLSTRAIELFQHIPSIGALILCPCCLPSSKQRNRTEEVVGENLYEMWADSLMKQTTEMVDNVATVRIYKDLEMNSNKNCIIVAVRRK